MPRIVSHIVDVYPYRVAGDTAKFLVLRRHRNARLGGTWQAVHGHIETGETAFDTAKRELDEETSLPVEAWHQLEYVNTFYVAGSDEIHMCACFAARVPSGVEPVLNEEHDAFIWAEMDAAVARFHWPGQARAIKEIGSLILPGSPAADSLRLA